MCPQFGELRSRGSENRNWGSYGGSFTEVGLGLRLRVYKSSVSGFKGLGFRV